MQTRETQRRYPSPEISSVCCGFAAVVAVVIGWKWLDPFATDQRLALSIAEAAWKGLVYASVLCIYWVLTAASRRSLRWILGFALVALAVVILASVSSAGLTKQNCLRFGATLWGIVTAQQILFFVCKIPRWRFPGQDEVPTDRNRQFQIIDVVGVTMAMAILLALTGKLFPPVDARAYWGMMIAIWVLLPPFILLAMMAHLPGSNTRRAIGILLSVLFATGMAVIVARVEFALKESVFAQEGIEFFEVWIRYQALLLSYVLATNIFVWSGYRQPQASNETPLLP